MLYQEVGIPVPPLPKSLLCQGAPREVSIRKHAKQLQAIAIG
jgi:hypothetical protein